MGAMGIRILYSSSCYYTGLHGLTHCIDSVLRDRPMQQVKADMN